MKISLNGINRLEMTEEMVSELEGRLTKITKFEKQKRKRLKKRKEKKRALGSMRC